MYDDQSTEAIGISDSKENELKECISLEDGEVEEYGNTEVMKRIESTVIIGLESID